MTKKYILATLCLIFSLHTFAQRQTLIWQDTIREYIIHVPSSWDGQRELPVVYVLHGLGNRMGETDTALNMSMYSDLTGWIAIIPQALKTNVNFMGFDIDLGEMWNAGLSVDVMGQTITPNSNVDDQGFILSILDTLSVQYPIDRDSIFIAGGSMGGFMANRMAIEHSDIFNGMAAISGTIPNAFTDTLPSNHINVLYIHGTNDQIVNYSDGSTDVITFVGNISLGLGAEQSVDYWKNANTCNSMVTIDSLPDRKEDGLRFIRYKYSNTDDETKVHFIKIEGGEHKWYTDANIYDTDYPTEIYNFFSNNNIPYMSLLNIASIEKENNFTFYPNPANDKVNIYSNEEGILFISNSLGQVIKKINVPKGNTSLNISSFNSGVYFLTFESKNNTLSKRLIIK